MRKRNDSWLFLRQFVYFERLWKGVVIIVYAPPISHRNYLGLSNLSDLQSQHWSKGPFEGMGVWQYYSASVFFWLLDGRGLHCMHRLTSKLQSQLVSLSKLDFRPSPCYREPEGPRRLLDRQRSEGGYWWWWWSAVPSRCLLATGLFRD